MKLLCSPSLPLREKVLLRYMSTKPLFGSGRRGAITRRIRAERLSLYFWKRKVSTWKPHYTSSLKYDEKGVIRESVPCVFGYGPMTSFARKVPSEVKNLYVTIVSFGELAIVTYFFERTRAENQPFLGSLPTGPGYGPVVRLPKSFTAGSSATYGIDQKLTTLDWNYSNSREKDCYRRNTTRQYLYITSRISRARCNATNRKKSKNYLWRPSSPMRRLFEILSYHATLTKLGFSRQ